MLTITASKALPFIFECLKTRDLSKNYCYKVFLKSV